MRNRKTLTERAEKFMEKFQNNLAYLRDENGHTQESLAIAIGIRTNTLQNYEYGVTCPDISTVYEICCECGVTLDYFLPEDKEEKNTLMSRINKLNTEKKKLLETYIDLLEQL